MNATPTLHWTEEVCLLGMAKTHFDTPPLPLGEFRRAKQSDQF
jgi:hypothetical protein